MSVNELMAINCLSGINTGCKYFVQLKVRKRKQTTKKLKDTIFLFIRHNFLAKLFIKRTERLKWQKHSVTKWL